jgi:hypothetical protein
MERKGRGQGRSDSKIIYIDDFGVGLLFFPSHAPVSHCFRYNTKRSERGTVLLPFRDFQRQNLTNFFALFLLVRNAKAANRGATHVKAFLNQPNSPVTFQRHEEATPIEIHTPKRPDFSIPECT